MALDVVGNWHDHLAQQERQRVMLRIANGTKASSPQILNARRTMPLFYSNPLPDNSSGSKNRPIGLMKDESGRPNANEIVAMNQAKHHFSHGGSDGVMEGGVLRHFKYAQQILKQRARDSENINLASQGLPPNPEPGVELNEMDSRNMELDALLTGINDSINMGTISNLTVNELKNVPRLLIFLSPTIDETRLSDLMDYIDRLIETLTTLFEDSESDYGANALRIKSFLETIKAYLTAFAEYVNDSEETKRAAAVSIGKRVFKLKAIKPRAARIPAAPAAAPPPPPEVPGGEEEAPGGAAGEDAAPAPAAELPARVVAGRPRVPISEEQYENLQTAYRNNDLETLAEFIQDNSTLSDKWWRTRTKAANAIFSLTNRNIKLR